jgi:hypothetical protein
VNSLTVGGPHGPRPTPPWPVPARTNPMSLATSGSGGLVWTRDPPNNYLMSIITTFAVKPSTVNTTGTNPAPASECGMLTAT